GHRLRRHPADPARARPGGVVRGGRGAAARAAAVDRVAGRTGRGLHGATVSDRRDAAARAGRTRAGAGADRLRRRALDSRHLHDRGPRLGPFGCAHLCLSETREAGRPAGCAGRRHRQLPDHAGQERRPGVEDLRELGRAAGRGRVRAHRRAPAREDRREGAGRRRHRPVHRLPARSGRAGRQLRFGRAGRGRGAGYPGFRRARPSPAGRGQDYPGSARQPAAARGRAGARRPGRPADRPVGRRALHLQPRSRRVARHPDRAHRAHGPPGEPPVSRLAVVLFNLGGPDGPQAVRPFLFNLFRDPAIIGAPALVRYPLASYLSRSREKTAKANYAILGGGSPLLPETKAQAKALEAELAVRAPEIEARVFIAMRYWKPLADETAREVAAFAPDEIVLLPLYPQYSTTTTGSSVKDWTRAYRGPGRTRVVCCYPTAPGLVAAHARMIERAIEAVGGARNLRLLFSAHGLPKKVV